MPQTAKTDSLKVASVTKDSFLGGRILVAQPRSGFRAGLDSVMLAAAVNRKSLHILELGSGVGAAACCVLESLPESEMVLVEDQTEMLELAEANLKRNGFSNRAQTICLDVTAKGSEREAAGIGANDFTSIIANPPFFVTGSSTPPPNAERAAARHMGKGQLDLWVKTAAASAAPAGEAIFIHLAQFLPELLEAFARRFGSITVLPIVPRPGEAATRVLVRGIKGSRAPLKLLSPLVLHGKNGRGFAAGAERIFRGEGALDW
ncbi:MAG TPA: methyltransferase [Devosia sp.]|nr:methyltransferase [Devosia sp.]